MKALVEVTPSARSAGSFGDASMDTAGNVRVVLGASAGGGGSAVSLSASASTTSPNNVYSTAYENSHVLKASAGKLFGLVGYNSGPAQFIMIFDSASVPADGQTPVIVIAVPATSNFFYNPGIYERAFANGIVWVNSTTAPTKTIGAANCFVDGQVL